jgi:hypothetical protein
LARELLAFLKQQRRWLASQRVNECSSLALLPMQTRLMQELQQVRWLLEQLLLPLRDDRGELLAFWFLGFHPCVCVLFLEYFSDSMFLRFSLVCTGL